MRILKSIILALSISLLCQSAYSQEVYSIITCPGENTSSSMNISWASEKGGTLVQLFESTKGPKKSKVIVPESEELCSVYDSIYSKAADGTNYYERVKFLKCGATITNLRKDTKYTYYIIDKDGNRLCEPHHFKTSGAKEWSACIISDFHSYLPLPDRLKSGLGMVETIKAYDPSMDWVLHLGDVCAWGGSYSFWKEMYSKPTFSEFFWAGLNGNHDNMTRQSFLTNEFFRNANYVPQNGYEGEEGVCYHFRYNDAMFIMLNNEDMRSDEGLEKAQTWVRKVVNDAKSSKNPPRYIIVCEHYQWFFGETGKFSQFSRWNTLFDELGVDLALGANNHIYVRSHPIKDGKVVSPSTGTVYIQTTSSDNERGSEMEPTISYNEELIAKRFTEGGRTISGINLSGNKKELKLVLLDRSGNEIDSVIIPAKKK